jgi:putative oxidoreductase
MNVALLVLRVVVGALFVGHGCQKLCGWFGGRGLKGTASFFESVGLSPGLPLAVLAGLSELAGGLLLGFGFFVPVAALLLTGVMTTAIVAVHWRNGVWNQDGGFEFPLVLATVAFAVAAIGPGTISLDNWVGIDWSGLIWAVDAVVLGAIGGLAGYALGRIVGTQSASEKGEGSGTSPARTRGPILLWVVGVGVLAALAAMVAATMVAATAVGIPFDGPIGDRTARPATVFEVEDAYEQSIGKLTVDLSDLAPPAGKTKIRASVGIGQLTIRVPEDVGVKVDAHVTAGEALVLGDRENGWDVDQTVVDGADADAPPLVIDVEVGLGELEVRRA